MVGSTPHHHLTTSTRQPATTHSTCKSAKQMTRRQPATTHTTCKSAKQMTRRRRCTAASRVRQHRQTQSPELPGYGYSSEISPSRPTRDALCRWKSRDPVKSAKRRPGLAGMEELFRSTKVEALPIGLWPKLFSVSRNAEPGFNYSLSRLDWLE